MSISLAVETEKRLEREASRQCLTSDQCANQLIEQQLNANDQARRDSLVALMQLWIDEDIADNQAFDDEFIETLDEDRPAERKLFPPELKGISW